MKMRDRERKTDRVTDGMGVKREKGKGWRKRARKKQSEERERNEEIDRETKRDRVSERMTEYRSKKTKPVWWNKIYLSYNRLLEEPRFFSTYIKYSPIILICLITQ